MTATRKHCLAAAAIVLMVSGAECPTTGWLPLLPGAARIVDLSGFREFEFTHGEAMGGCSEDYYKAVIRRQNDGSYTLEITDLGTWTGVYGGRWEDYIGSGGESAAKTDSTTRPLTDAEVQKLLEAFRSVRIIGQDSWICTDGCDFYNLRWDDFNPYAGYGCSDEFDNELSGGELERIAGVINELRNAASQER